MLCDNCDKPAEYTGAWPWGDPIKVCRAHMLEANQKARQQLDIPTGIPFSVVDPGKPVELGRDERTHLRAQILTRDDELADLNRRIVTTSKANAELAEETRRLRGVSTGLEKQLNDCKAELIEALASRDKALADAGHAIAERDRLELTLRNLATSPVGYPKTEGSGRGTIETPENQ